MQDAEAALEHRQLDHGEEVDGELFEARGEAAMLLEPAHDAFDDVALPVRAAVELWTRALIRPRRNHRANAALSQVAAHRGKAVALVARQGARPRAPVPEPHAAQRGLDLPRLVRLPGGERRGQRDAAAVDHQVELGAEAATRAAERMIRRFA